MTSDAITNTQARKHAQSDAPEEAADDANPETTAASRGALNRRWVKKRPPYRLQLSLALKERRLGRCELFRHRTQPLA
jgi:hypothetical protein